MADTKRVFIVHGNNHHVRDEVAQYISELGLHPVILDEEPNQGDTILEKFERHAQQADYALVLLTPDDMGGKFLEIYQLFYDNEKNNLPLISDAKSLTRSFQMGRLAQKLQNIQGIEMTAARFSQAYDIMKDLFQGKVQYRARQNVILELGFFMAKLGRSRVCALFVPGVELPSDIHGLLNIELKEGWKNRLLRELRNADMLI